MYHFMDMGLMEVRDFPVFTLGPEGTSSESAAQFFGRWMQETYPDSQNIVHLHSSYEMAREALSKKSGLLIVANAYPQINDFYMDTKLRLTGAFTFDTPLYGLVALRNLPDRPLSVASHPAPIPLIHELLPPGVKIAKIINTLSTSIAAKMVADEEADIALTTSVAAKLHKLEFISPTRPIHMLWSIFRQYSQ